VGEQLDLQHAVDEPGRQRAEVPHVRVHGLPAVGAPALRAAARAPSLSTRRACPPPLGAGALRAAQDRSTRSGEPARTDVRVRRRASWPRRRNGRWVRRRLRTGTGRGEMRNASIFIRRFREMWP
jgi:hypothetical protein